MSRSFGYGDIGLESLKKWKNYIIQGEEIMFKMLIVFDEERVREEGLYEITDLQHKIDYEMEEEGISLGKDGWYKDITLKNCLILIGAFSKVKWFRHYIKEWKILDLSDGTIEDALLDYPQL